MVNVIAMLLVIAGTWASVWGIGGSLRVAAAAAGVVAIVTALVVLFDPEESG